MKVMVARTAGFCWGVRRAMDAVLEAAARRPGPVRTLGPLIHNPQALDLLAGRGVVSVEDPQAAAGGTLLVRAHGIPIQQLRDLKARHAGGELELVNATCPEVAKVHSKIKKWAPKGYFTVILGTHGHAESTAHQSYAVSGSAIVSSMAEAKALTDAQLARVLVVAQTTFTAEDFRSIVAYLRIRAGDMIVENTICEDTNRRQAEAARVAESVDAVVVVGGRNSSNTRHLAELATRAGKPVQFVETASELDLGALRHLDAVGVLAGASTPTWLVEEVVDLLEQEGSGAARWGRFLGAAFRQPLLLALGAVLLTLGVHTWMGLVPRPVYAAMAGCYMMGIYLLAPYMDPHGLGTKGPVRGRFLLKHRRLLVGLAALVLLVALGLAAFQGPIPLAVTLVATGAGLLYKRPLRLGRRAVSLSSIPGSKDVLVALALGIMSVALPLWDQGLSWDLRAWSAILLVSSMAFARTVIRNVRDMQQDQILGRETLPILLGRRAATVAMTVTLALALGLALWVTFTAHLGQHPLRQALVLALATTYPVAHLYHFHHRFKPGKPRYEPPVELGFAVLGLLALL